MNAISREKL